MGKFTGKKTCLSISISHSPGPLKTWTSLFNSLVSCLPSCSGDWPSLPRSPADCQFWAMGVYPGATSVPRTPGSQSTTSPATGGLRAWPCAPALLRSAGLPAPLQHPPAPLQRPPRVPVAVSSPPKRMTPGPSSFQESSPTLLRKASLGSPC